MREFLVVAAVVTVLVCLSEILAADWPMPRKILWGVLVVAAWPIGVPLYLLLPRGGLNALRRIV
jgi:hypothetical protein